MEPLDPERFMDELLNFSSDIGEEDDEEHKPRKALLPSSASFKINGVLGQDDPSRSFHEIAEEELEWLSNKDAFPAVETFVGGIIPDHTVGVLKHHSPVSVLESSTTSSNSNSNSNCTNSNIALMSSCGNLKAPRRARSKRGCRRRHGGFAEVLGKQLLWSLANNKTANANVKAEAVTKTKTTMMTTIGRKCQHCGAEKTPQWRAGPLGPKTLCNACGVRYKSGRLVPEYRPASSPTFSSEKHSNSHRKVMEMRRLKQVMGMVANL
ncbi:hypothetical protein FNV43_RR02256 [Rhamnella rubrinervis]|uniref:GATA-type domain-containing protein n=1 Tax=Rhamnella rubrinervis TaxID=2594499 RepID=A0A8K0MTN0_9ROSA|nr:hypothetical protein FNV43_RR02256 [Rhamnella rubrinervis]